MSLRRLREDAGVSGAAVARAARLSPAAVSMIERGAREPGLETLCRLVIALGAELRLGVVPGAGVPLRDRFQAPMVEALLAAAHHRWARFVEVSVRTPARGSIDVVLGQPAERLLVAVEVCSQIRRLEQLLRWTAEKAEALPATGLGAAMAGQDQRPVSVSRLLVVRSTGSTRRVAAEFAETLRAAYPARSRDAVRALLRPNAPWPGAAIVWMTVGGGRAALLSGAARGVGVGR